MKHLHFHIDVPPGYALHYINDRFVVQPFDRIEGEHKPIELNFEELQRQAKKAESTRSKRKR